MHSPCTPHSPPLALIDLKRTTDHLLLLTVTQIYILVPAQHFLGHFLALEVVIAAAEKEFVDFLARNIERKRWQTIVTINQFLLSSLEDSIEIKDGLLLLLIALR